MKRMCLLLCLTAPAICAASLAQAQDHRIGVWNIEHLATTGDRGFPEIPESRRFPPRSDADLKKIGEYLGDEIRADALLVTEIAPDGDDGTPDKPRSAQLTKIVDEMGDDFTYFLGRSGGGQRVGLVFNKKRIKLKKIANLNTDEFLVQGEDIYHRDPVIFWVTLLDDGEEMNDLLLIGLHLKSQQKYVHNHLAAVAKLMGDLSEDELREDLELPLPSDEDDVIILGDLNDSAHRKRGFKFLFDYLEGIGFRHLGSDLSRYPATRVNGSQIDHILVSDVLFQRGIDVETFRVHQKPHDERREYRKVFSDHFPVTVDITAHEDDD